MVKKTDILCKVHYAFLKKQIFKRQGLYKVTKAPHALSNVVKEKNVVDAHWFVNPPREKWIPPPTMPPDLGVPVSLDNRPAQKQTDTTSVDPLQPWMHKYPVWHLKSGTFFTEGINHACLLTKTQRFDGLPLQIQQLKDKYFVENQDHMVQRIIMHALEWEGTKDMLPRRIDLEKISFNFRREFGIPESKSAHYLLTDFLRLSQSMSGRIPEVTSQRCVIHKPEVHALYNFRGEKIEVDTMNELMVLGRQPLPRLGDQELVDQSVNHPLLNMHPVLPTIDLEQTWHYSENNMGAVKDIFEVPTSHPQIVLRINGPTRAPEHHQAFNLMNVFAIAHVEAINRYGVDSGNLSSPITVLNVNTNYNTMNFLVFQLNTLDVNNEEGVKNFAWFDTGNQLFARIKTQPWKEANFEYKPTIYKDYNPEVFKKFLALFLYGFAK